MYIHPHLKLFLKDLFFDALRSGFNLLFQKKKMPEADLSCKSRIAHVYECAYDCVFRVITVTMWLCVYSYLERKWTAGFRVEIRAHTAQYGVLCVAGQKAHAGRCLR